jgi:hypothetical protein
LYFHILACSQIWLNLHVDHQHFGYIAKLTKRNTDLGNENAKLDRYKHTNLETLNFDSSLVVKGFLSFQSQYINIIYNLFKRHEVLKNSMDKLQNLISKNIYILNFFSLPFLVIEVHMNLCKVQVTLNWDILSSIHDVNFLWGLISFYWCSSNITLKFCSLTLISTNNLALKFENDNFSLKLHFKLWTFH